MSRIPGGHHGVALDAEFHHVAEALLVHGAEQREGALAVGGGAGDVKQPERYHAPLDLLGPDQQLGRLLLAVPGGGLDMDAVGRDLDRVTELLREYLAGPGGGGQGRHAVLLAALDDPGGDAVAVGCEDDVADLVPGVHRHQLQVGRLAHVEADVVGGPSKGEPVLVRSEVVVEGGVLDFEVAEGMEVPLRQRAEGPDLAAGVVETDAWVHQSVPWRKTPSVGKLP
jgi:hypothetical protein